MDAISYMPRVLAIAALGVAIATHAQTPPTQPAYPSSQPKRAVNPAQRNADDSEPQRRCDQLTGLEKSECERRDNTDDDAPAGVTRSMREKEEKAREEKEAASTTSAADPRSDTADARSSSKPTSASSSTTTASAKSDQDEEAETAKQPASESDTESDTLDRPRQQ